MRGSLRRERPGAGSRTPGMRAMLRALWTLLVQLFLGVIGQPVPGQSAAERARKLRQEERLRAGTNRVGPLAALRAVTREALLALTGQPSPEPRPASSRRKPRS